MSDLQLFNASAKERGLIDIVSQHEPALHPNEELVFGLGTALHQAGLPSHRLESMLERVAIRLGVKVHSFSLPTGLLLCSERAGLPVTMLIRLPPQATNLEKLRRLTVEAEALARGSQPPDGALARIRALSETPPRWGRGACVLGFTLSAAAFSVFFGGGGRELLIATAVGLCVGLVALLYGNKRGANRRFELAAAGVAGLIAGATDVYWIPLASGLIILLPGLALVDAIEELANGHLVSGVAKAAGVGVVLLALIFGVLLAVNLEDLILGAGTTAETIAFPKWVAIPALGVVTLGSIFRFQARLKDWIWVFLASAVAFGGSRLGATLGNPLMGPFLGALLLGFGANLYARLCHPTPQLLLVPGLALLVPGSFGLQSMNFMLSGDSMTGIEQGFQMFMAAIAIVAGLLFSNRLIKAESTRTT
ncbi:MAG: threonine/serine exporter family protein [Isosphaeraceae bacterium]|nr:threonine/serine exporter family protein [Isosphaeraceae bacterium]